MVVVMRMPMAMMVCSCGEHRLKHLLDLHVGNFQPIEHLTNCGVILNKQAILMKLCREMQVAHLPGVVCRLL